VSVDRPVHTRRWVLCAATGLAAAALTGACRSRSAAPSADRRLRVMMNGGIYEEHARRLVVDPFEGDTGASVEVVPGSAAQIITRLTAERAAPSVDVVIVDELVMGGAIDEGLFDTIDPGNVPSLADLVPGALDSRGYGPRVHCHNLALGYNTKRLGVDPPARWADLWDARFKGLVVPGAVELTPGLLFLLEANAINGGTYDNLDPGFAALKRLAPNVRKYYRNIGEVRPLVAGENVIVAISSNMLQVEIAQGSPVAIVFPAEGCLASPAVAQVVRGTRDKALAERFIDFYLRPEAQLGWARDYNVSVFNTKANVPPDITARIADKTVYFDPVAVSRHRAAWVDRWMREIRG
jgi:putative spermidine/putrescine transport system substrate-binding protein